MGRLHSSARGRTVAALSEELLAQALDVAEVATLFDWLRQLSFIEQGPGRAGRHFRWRYAAGIFRFQVGAPRHSLSGPWHALPAAVLPDRTTGEAARWLPRRRPAPVDRNS